MPLDEGPSDPRLDGDASKIPHILPHERVFPIQIGSELFQLSGASLSSDAPSYFSQFFQCQLKTSEESGDDAASSIRTLYIDRDPGTFRDIALHLQGYHVQPRDGTHFVRLFADAQFYSLPKLISQLYTESIFITIGHREFQIPRDLFEGPGNKPNFFTLGFAVFFSSQDDLFPGLDRKHLIRPPSIMPPSVPHRSADVFDELLHLLRGNPVRVRDEVHRQTLLRDCRYFSFKGLEQRLIPHALSYNPVRARREILLRVEDLLRSGLGVALDTPPDHEPLLGWVSYARPYVGVDPAELVLQVGGDTTRLHLPPDFFVAPAAPRFEWPAQVDFFLDVSTRIARLFQVVAGHLRKPLAGTGVVRAAIERDTAIVLDGLPYTAHRDQFVPGGQLAMGGGEQWVVRTGQWRIRVQGTGMGTFECVLVAVKLDAISSEHGRNVDRGFLPCPAG